MADENGFLTLDQAFYRAVHDYPGGVPAVAGTFGWNPRTLQNKINPTQTTHKLMVTEAESILELTRSPAILDTVCGLAGAAWFEVEQGEPSDMAMLDNITDLVSRVGDMSRKVQDSLADGRVDDGELNELHGIAMGLARAALGVVRRAEQFQ